MAKVKLCHYSTLIVSWLKGEDLKNAAAATKRLHDHINDKDEKIQEKWDEYKEAEKDEILRAKRYYFTLDNDHLRFNHSVCLCIFAR